MQILSQKNQLQGGQELPHLFEAEEGELGFYALLQMIQILCTTLEKFHFSLLLKFNSSVKLHSDVCLAHELKHSLNGYKFLQKFSIKSFDQATP